MSFWSRVWRGEDPLSFAAEPVATFPVETSLPTQVLGFTPYAATISIEARISRAEAIQVPAIKRARDLIAGSLGGLPLSVVDADHETRVSEFFDQPERNSPRSVTMTKTVEDMLFEGVAYWRVTERYADGYPSYIERVHPSRVQRDLDSNSLRIDGRLASWADVIMFESPNDALLVAGGGAIRTALRLDKSAANYSDGTPPIELFFPNEGADPADDSTVAEALGAYVDARRRGGPAYIPAALRHEFGGWDPQKLQLHEARQHAVLEIARLTGIEPGDLGVPVNTETYQNLQNVRKNFVDFTLGPYRQAIEDRLSMRDVTKRGYFVKFNLSAFLRSDDKTRMETYVLALQAGAITHDEIRDLEDRPATSAPKPVAALPSPAPKQEDVA